MMMISPLTALLLLILVVVFSTPRTPSEYVDTLAILVLAAAAIVMAVCVVLGLGLILLFVTVCFGVLQVVRLGMPSGTRAKNLRLKK